MPETLEAQGVERLFPGGVHALRDLDLTVARGETVVLAGVRTSAVLTVGTATLAAFIGCLLRPRGMD